MRSLTSTIVSEDYVVYAQVMGFHLEKYFFSM